MARVSLGDALGDPDDRPPAVTPTPTPAPAAVEAAPAAAEDTAGDDEPEPVAAAPEPAASRRTVKFTMQLDEDDDDRAARVVDAVLAELRAAGVRPRKQIRAELIRIMFAVADRDARFRGRVTKLLLRELGR